MCESEALWILINYSWVICSSKTSSHKHVPTLIRLVLFPQRFLVLSNSNPSALPTARRGGRPDESGGLFVIILQRDPNPERHIYWRRNTLTCVSFCERSGSWFQWRNWGAASFMECWANWCIHTQRPEAATHMHGHRRKQKNDFPFPLISLARTSRCVPPSRAFCAVFSRELCCTSTFAIPLGIIRGLFNVKSPRRRRLETECRKYGCAFSSRPFG